MSVVIIGSGGGKAAIKMLEELAPDMNEDERVIAGRMLLDFADQINEFANKIKYRDHHKESGDEK